MGPHRNDKQQKGMQSSIERAQAKIRDRWLSQKPTRAEVYELVKRLEAFDKLVYENVPAVREAIANLQAAAQQQTATPGEAMAETVVEGEETCSPVANSSPE